MGLIEEVTRAFAHVRRQQGWRAALNYLTLPLVEYHHGYILRRRLTEPIEIPFLAGDIVIRRAAPEDAAVLETIAPRLRVKRFVAKMRAGEVCLIAVEETRVIGIVWAALDGHATARDMPFALGATGAYLWGAFVSPECRSRGVMTALCTELLVWLKARDFETAYQLTNLSNTAALRQLGKIGSRAIGEIHLLRILKKRFKRYRPLAAPIEVSRWAAQV